MQMVNLHYVHSLDTMQWLPHIHSHSESKCWAERLRGNSQSGLLYSANGITVLPARILVDRVTRHHALPRIQTTIESLDARRSEMQHQQGPSFLW